MWPQQYQEELTFEDIQRIKLEKKRRRKMYIIIALSMVVIAAIIGFLAMKARQASIAPSADSAAAQITLHPTSLYPPEVKVKTGDTVIWANESGGPRRLVSDNYGQSGAFTFRGKRPFQREEAYYVIFDTPGTYKYHDETDPEKFKGTVIVE